MIFGRSEESRMGLMMNETFLKKVYFILKPILSKKLRIYLRRMHVFWKKSAYADIWPIESKAKEAPKGWTGWPDGKQFALVLTHDVETGAGQEKCISLANLEKSLGFRSSFNFIAEQYKLSLDCQTYLRRNGFEIGLHGLVHNGNPFRSREFFDKQKPKINRYLKGLNAAGFRCPSMYHKLEMIGELDIQYDSSTFDIDPFEPQPDGVGTIFPFWVQNGSTPKGFVEIPYTLPQDYTLFVLLMEKNIDIWKGKLDWIAEKGGMALLITHPDYMNFQNNKCRIDEYPMRFYEEFLLYLKDKWKGRYWHPLPREMALFWQKRNDQKEQENNQFNQLYRAT